jgi:hypothetical protein
MATSLTQRLLNHPLPIAIAACFLLACAFDASRAAVQSNARPKGKINCWIKCCPLEIGCTWDLSAARGKPPADITVKDGSLTADFKPTGDQKVYDVKQETRLDAKTAEALGFKEITLLPGQYPVTTLRNGLARVTIKVKAVPVKAGDTSR